MWRRGRVASIALLALAAACAEAPPGVNVQKLALDVAFGAKDVTPANFGPAQPPQLPPLPPIRGFPRTLPPLPPRPSVCPEASLNTFPALAAALNVEQTAPVGSYRWKRKGTVEKMVLTLTVKVPIDGFETRLIRNARKVSAAQYTFESVQTDVNGTTVVQSWTVNTQGFTQDLNPGLSELPNARIGEPERGLVLSKVQEFNAAGDLTGSFTPVPGILYLPLPVQPGESWTSTGVDATTGQTLRHEGTVTGRQRVDACGEVVDGWAVTAHQTVAGVAPADRDYTYIVATQYGGILTSEVIKGMTSAGTLDASFSIGQLTPAPLPEEPQ